MPTDRLESVLNYIKTFLIVIHLRTVVQTGGISAEERGVFTFILMLQ